MRLSRTCAAVGVVACLGQVTTGPAAADDMVLHGMVHAAMVRSPYAHAKITGINTDSVKDMPGAVGWD